MSEQDSDQSKPHGRRHRRGTSRNDSIRKRVVRVALIPCVALILLYLNGAIFLGVTSFRDQQVASGVRQVSIPAVAGLASVEKERQLSMAYLSSHAQSSLQQLLAQQKISDQGLAAMQAAAGPLQAGAPAPIIGPMSSLTGYLGELPDIRGRIDAGAATAAEVSRFYDNLLNSATSLFETQARVLPDANVVPGAIAAGEIFHVSDLASQAGSLISGALASGRLDQSDYLQFTSLVGAYHAVLGTTLANLLPDTTQEYSQLIRSPQWQQLSTAENAIILHGQWAGGAPANLRLTSASWQGLTDFVGAALTNMTVTQTDQTSQLALNNGNNTLVLLGIVLVIELLVIIGSIWWARRQAAVVVGSALVTRLARLRQDAQEMVTEKLPAMVARLRAGEVVDAEQQFPEAAYGDGDEIERVATAISAVLRQAVTAAAGEAQARGALSTVFRGIARRNQLPLYNMLRQLDSLEQTEQDSIALERLYRLDHEATRARRNSENLIILSGGEIGQHLPGPVRMLDVLRSAMSETHEYQRVKLKGAVPSVSIAAEVATGLIHLIAELLENASRFSPPSYEVLVRSMPAQAGVIVEVEDRGLGMPTDRRERVNETLAEPPEVDVMAIGDGSQLGFWVIASLIKRYGFRVALRESDYGGILAIVRIPNNLVVAESDSDTPSGALVGVAEHRAPRHAADDATMVLPRISVAAVADKAAGTANGRSGGRSTGSANGLANSPARGSSTNGTANNGTANDTPAHAAIATTATTAASTAPGAAIGKTSTADDPLAGRSSRTQVGEQRESTGRDEERQWPTEAPDDEPVTRSPLPQRSPGHHLNPRLTAEALAAGARGDEDAGAGALDVGAAMAAFQRGSEAGRAAGDSSTR